MSYSDLTVALDDVVDPVWGLAVRDRVINPMANAAAIASAITSPVEGMTEYLEDIHQHVFYDGTAWCPMPGSMIIRANRTSSSTATTTEVGVLRTSVSLLAGQAVLVLTSPLLMYSTTATDVIACRVRYTVDGSTPSTSSTILSTVAGYCAAAQTHTPFAAKYIAATNLTFKPLLTVGRASGSGSVSILANANVPDIDLMVIAAGTAPADTGTDI